MEKETIARSTGNRPTELQTEQCKVAVLNPYLRGAPPSFSNLALHMLVST